MQFYQDFGELKCLQGDTLSAFNVTIDDAEEELTGFEMRLILEKKSTPGGIVLQKICERSGNTFRVQLTSENTKNLSGAYQVYFSVTAPDGLKYKKITGTLIVAPAPQEG